MQEHRAGCGLSGMRKIAQDTAARTGAAREAAKALIQRDAFGLDRRDELTARLLEFGTITVIVIAGQKPGQLVKRRMILRLRRHAERDKAWSISAGGQK